MKINEWDMPIVKDIAEKDFDRAKASSQFMDPLQKDQFLREAMVNLEIHKNYQKRTRDLFGFFVMCGLFAVGAITSFFCDFLLKGASPSSLKLKGSFLEGQESSIRLLGIGGAFLAFCFGLSALFWLLHFISSSLKKQKKMRGDSTC